MHIFYLCDANILHTLNDGDYTGLINNIFCTILCRSSGKKCEMLPVGEAKGEKNFFQIAFLWLAPPPSACRATSKTGLRSVRKYREQGGNRGVCYIDYSGSRTSEHEVVGRGPPGRTSNAHPLDFLSCLELGVTRHFLFLTK